MNRLQILKDFRAAADPSCPDCLGDGIVSVTCRGSQDNSEDVACHCVSRDWLREQDQREWNEDIYIRAMRQGFTRRLPCR